jgi:two-component system CheB/CheR fusion protein
MNHTSAPSQPAHAAQIPVVGLGASAGGIKALKEFFASVPPSTGIAWVVILHLSPDHDSKLAEVLQTTASLPVTQVTERVAIQPDHVYVISPNRSLEISDDTLILSEMTRVEQRRSPVDVFFRTLADAHGSQSAAVVLSGTGPNGSAGIKRVKEYGGLTIAQDPNEAEYGDMPRNSIATGLVDFILPIAQIPARIVSFFQDLQRGERHSRAAVADDEALRDVLALLRVRTGHDFSNYKTATVQRRIERRIHLRGLSSAADYAHFIRQRPDEATALMKELLISVTNFFRDPAAWTALEERVIPRMLQDKRTQDQVRVWVPGCATGEEAYSIAMLLSEHLSLTAELPAIQVFGTDLDEEAIGVAREGFYSAAEIADVSDERLQRFFVKTDGGGHRVRRDLRERLLFAHHNVIRDPPFSHLDLICCRNLLIYLNRSIQERIIATFHFALRPGGHLFLGTAESPEGANDLFLRVDGNAHIYESRTVTSRVGLPIAATPMAPPVLRTSSKAADPRSGGRISPADLHQRLLEQYAPPSVVVTEEHNIVHMSESAGRYLQVPGGEPSRDLLRLVRPDLRPDLRTALHQSALERVRVDVRKVRASFDEGIRAVDIAVRPVLRDGDPANGYFLVLFHESAADAARDDTEQALTLDSPAEPLTRQLENELDRVKEQLRLTVEQYETQVDEAKASNEELQAMNEELRSAAEELETSKEELQSVNEEMTTVNQELKVKIEELGLANNDFQNFINSTDIATIFLDRSLRVKLFTPRAQDIFNLLPTDTGRPLSNITSRLSDERIHRDVRSVLDSLQTVEREVPTSDGRWHLMRVLPYRTTDNHIDGVVVTFLDITGRRTAESQVRRSEERLRLLIDSAVDYAIFTLTEEALIDSWNVGAERLYGYNASEIIGRRVDVLFTPEDRAMAVPAKELEDARRTGRAAGERFHVRQNGTLLYVSAVTTRLGEGGIGFANIARDLTEPRDSAQALYAAHSELEFRVKQRTDDLEFEKSTVTNLLRRLVSAQEDERSRIARDLHDSLGQQLTALRLALERHEQRCTTTTGDAAIADALALTRSVSQQIDFLAWELRPSVLDDLGLMAALPRFVDAWSSHVGIAAQCRLDGFQSGRLTREAEVAFYRIAQEALNNVSKHAHANRADVVMTSSGGQIVLVIEDDGVGFDVLDSTSVRTGIGLASMRERASLVGGSFEVESVPGRGTSIFVKAPDAGASSGSEP